MRRGVWSEPSATAILSHAKELDRRLLSIGKTKQRALIVATTIVMAGVWCQYVPRAYDDYAKIPLLNHIRQYEIYGTDSISDMYVAKVILNDPGDMYTKAKLAQTPLEARTWSKEASGPYPPLVLLSEAGLYRLGEWTGLEFYGMILLLACLFLGLSAWYFLETRWYLFPLLYLNGAYFAYRFVYVQDGTYLVMLVVIMLALFAARRGRSITHALMAIAIVMKLSPLYYARNMVTMTRPAALVFAGVLIAGLVLPYFIWDNYLYIFGYHNAIKGDRLELAGAVLVALPFTILLWYVETRGHFDLEDRVGWGLVPFALFVALKMNVARHLLIVLLVPDKRGTRNIAAAVAMGLPNLFPWMIRFNSALALATLFLFVSLIYQLQQIGWRVVGDDFKHPLDTIRLMLNRGEAKVPAAVS